MAEASSSGACSEEFLIPVIEFQDWYSSQEMSDPCLPYLSEHKRLKDGAVKMDFSFPVDDSQFTIVCPDDYPRATNIVVKAVTPKLNKWCNNVNLFLNDRKGSIKLASILTKCLNLYSEQQKPAKHSPMEVDKSPGDDSDFEDSHSIDDKANEAEVARDSEELDDVDCMEDNFTTDFDIKMDLLKKKWFAKEVEFRNKLAEEKLAAARKVSSSLGDNVKIETKLVSTSPASDGNLFSKFLPAVSSTATKPKDVKEGQQIFDHANAAFQILTNEMIGMIKSGKNDGYECSPIDDCLYKWNVKMRDFPVDSQLAKDLSELKKLYGVDYVEMQLDFVPDYPFYPPLLSILRPRFQGSLVQSLTIVDLLQLTYWNPTKTVSDVLNSIKEILLKHAKLDLKNKKNDPKRHPEGAYLPVEALLIKLALASETRPRANFETINVDNLQKAPVVKCEPKHHQHQKESARGGFKAGTGYGSGRNSSSWTPETTLKANLEKERQILNVLCCIKDELSTYKTGSFTMASDDFYSIIEGSVLVPYLEKMLHSFTESSIELGLRLDFYNHALDILYSVSEISCLMPLFSNLPHQKYCLMYYLENLKKQIECLKKLKQKVKKQKMESAEQLEEDLESFKEEKLLSLMEKIKKNMKEADLTYSLKPQDVNAVVELKESFEAQYIRILKPMQFCEFKFEGAKHQGRFAHSFISMCKEQYTTEIRAIWKEWSVLRSSLPLSTGTGLFVRYDDDKMNLLRALIIGPEDTPYANGCFLFDICFPVGYPIKPPLVKIHTTGGGKVRFNPNLYHCGKVCLSLLGTWGGDKGESWNPQTSTVLQVLVSIQSLIMVEHPYFNEPGYESTMGTKDGDAKSLGYNKPVRKHCIELAMTDMLNNLPPGFEDVVKYHFKMKKTRILEQVKQWLSEDSGLKYTVAELEKAFYKLEDVVLPKA